MEKLIDYAGLPSLRIIFINNHFAKGGKHGYAKTVGSSSGVGSVDQSYGGNGHGSEGRRKGGV
jgi:hypothetical protein